MGQIGFILQILLLICFFFIDKKAKKITENQSEDHVWGQQIFMTLCIYFLCAASINPWYIVPVLAFSIFTKWRFSCYLDLSFTAFLLRIFIKFLIKKISI